MTKFNVKEYVKRLRYLEIKKEKDACSINVELKDLAKSKPGIHISMKEFFDIDISVTDTGRIRFDQSHSFIQIALSDVPKVIEFLERIDTND